MSAYTVHTLAQFVGVSDRTIERWYKKGKLPRPATLPNGTKVWSAAQAREVLEIRKTAVKRRITKSAKHG